MDLGVHLCLALGAGTTQGARMPRSPYLLGAAVAMAASYLVLLHVMPHWPAGQAWAVAREQHFWLGSSKTYESPLRLLHVLALVYIFTAYADAPVVRLVHRAGRNTFLARLGRRSLPVFTFGAIHALLANELLAIVERAWGKASLMAVGFEIAVVELGLMAMGLITERRRWPLRVPVASGQPHAAPIAVEHVSRA